MVDVGDEHGPTVPQPTRGVEVARPESLEVDGDVPVAARPATAATHLGASLRSTAGSRRARPRCARCRRSAERGTAGIPCGAGPPLHVRPGRGRRRTPRCRTGRRLARHAAAGLSHVRSPRRRDASRTSALVKPASTSGNTAPASAAARCPGRWSPRSSTLTPSTTTASCSGCDRRHDVHQLGLAVEAPVGVVATIGRPLHLEGLDRRPRPTPLGRQLTAVGLLRTCQRRRHRSDRGDAPPNPACGARPRRGTSSRHRPRTPRPPSRTHAGDPRAHRAWRRRHRSVRPLVPKSHSECATSMRSGNAVREDGLGMGAPLWWKQRRFGLMIQANLATVPAWAPIGEYAALVPGPHRPRRPRRSAPSLTARRDARPPPRPLGDTSSTTTTSFRS